MNYVEELTTDDYGHLVVDFFRAEKLEGELESAWYNFGETRVMVQIDGYVYSLHTEDEVVVYQEMVRRR